MSNGNPYTKVQSGQPLRFPAKLYNDLIDLLERSKVDASSPDKRVPARTFTGAMRLGLARAVGGLFKGRMLAPTALAPTAGSWLPYSSIGRPQDDQEVIAVALNAFPSTYPVVDLGMAGTKRVVGFWHGPKLFRVTAATSAGTNKWSYTLLEQRKTGPGIDAWQDSPDASPVTGYNLNEKVPLPGDVTALAAIPTSQIIAAFPMACPHTSEPIVEWWFYAVNDCE